MEMGVVSSSSFFFFNKCCQTFIWPVLEFSIFFCVCSSAFIAKLRVLETGEPAGSQVAADERGPTGSPAFARRTEPIDRGSVFKAALAPPHAQPAASPLLTLNHRDGAGFRDSVCRVISGIPGRLRTLIAPGKTGREKKKKQPARCSVNRSCAVQLDGGGAAECRMAFSH